MFDSFIKHSFFKVFLNKWPFWRWSLDACILLRCRTAERKIAEAIHILVCTYVYVEEILDSLSRSAVVGRGVMFSN